MADHQITCVTKEMVKHPHPHEHIASVGVDGARYTVGQIVSAMDADDTFYTVSPSTNKRATVHAYECRQCLARIIRSAPDAIHDNNLENLRTC